MMVRSLVPKTTHNSRTAPDSAPKRAKKPGVALDSGISHNLEKRRGNVEVDALEAQVSSMPCQVKAELRSKPLTSEAKLYLLVFGVCAPPQDALSRTFLSSSA